jgi:hypothetical protein
VAKLTAERRKREPKSDFGLPSRRAYPMPDKSHAANAKARASQQVKAGHLSESAKERIDAKANRVLGESHHEGKSMKHKEHDCKGKHCEHPSHRKEHEKHREGHKERRREHERKGRHEGKHYHAKGDAEARYEREEHEGEAPIRVPKSHPWPNDDRGIAPARSNQMMSREAARHSVKMHRGRK